MLENKRDCPKKRHTACSPLTLARSISSFATCYVVSLLSILSHQKDVFTFIFEGVPYEELTLKKKFSLKTLDQLKVFTLNFLLPRNELLRRAIVKTNSLWNSSSFLHFQCENHICFFIVGGQISIDAYPVGWDKRFCLQYLEPEGYSAIHFVGDKILPGGNDHKIYEDPRTIGHQVSCPNDTIELLKTMFSNLG